MEKIRLINIDNIQGVFYGDKNKENMKSNSNNLNDNVLSATQICAYFQNTM